MCGNLTAGIVNAATGVNNLIVNNPGYNPVGISTITVTASPMTYTAGPTPEVIILESGVITSATRGGKIACATLPCEVTLPPNGVMVLTYPGAAPVLWKDVQ